MLVWLPFDPAELGDPPSAFDYEVVRSLDEVPGSVGEVEIFVPPYSVGPEVRDVLPRMTSLRLVQTLTAGVDNLRDAVPDGVTLCNGRGIHDTSTAELVLTLVLASLRGVPGFVRMISGGSDDVTRAIASRLQWQPAQAEAAKRALGMGTQMMRPEDRPVLEIIYEVVGEMLAGVRNTLSYYASAKPTAPVARILLTGGGARMIGLPNALADLTGLPVGLADPLVGVTVAKSAAGEIDGSIATALGLALGDHS